MTIEATRLLGNWTSVQLNKIIADQNTGYVRVGHGYGQDSMWFGVLESKEKGSMKAFGTL